MMNKLGITGAVIFGVGVPSLIYCAYVKPAIDRERGCMRPGSNEFNKFILLLPTIIYPSVHFGYYILPKAYNIYKSMAAIHINNP